MTYGNLPKHILDYPLCEDPWYEEEPRTVCEALNKFGESVEFGEWEYINKGRVSKMAGDLVLLNIWTKNKVIFLTDALGVKLLTYVDRNPPRGGL